MAAPQARTSTDSDLSSIGLTNVRGGGLNKRGRATRRHVLAVAIRVLASSHPGAVSANLIAKEAGVTWGTVRHTFGGTDGLWSATLDELMTPTPIVPPTASTSVVDRLREIIDTLWTLMDTPLTRAVENLRAALPDDHGELLGRYPRTAASLDAWDRKWRAEYESVFNELQLPADRVEAARSLLPAAVRGLLVERQLSNRLDVASARESLARGLALYLEEQP